MLEDEGAWPRLLWLESAVAGYIRGQGERYRSRSQPLGLHESSKLQGYFSVADLERVRVLEMHEERLEEPVFYRDLRVLEMGELPNFSLMRLPGGSPEGEMAH